MPPLLGGGQLGLAEHAGLRVAAGPRDDRGRPGAEEVDPGERAVLLVERDRAVLDLVLADVVAVEVEVQRGLELAGVRTAAGELALAPVGQELLVDGEQAPPADGDALGVGLEVGAAGDQVEVGPVRAVAVQEDDLLEPVVGEALGDVEHAVDEVLEVGVDGPGEVHDVPGVAVVIGGQDQHLVGNVPARALGDLGRDRRRPRRAAGAARAARRRRTAARRPCPARPRR